MLWIVAVVVATFLFVIAVLAVATALKAELEPLEIIARSGMKVGHAAAALVVLGVLIDFLQGHRPDELWISVGYAVACVGVPTLLLNRQPDEDGNPSDPPHLYVIAVAALATAVLTLRLVQTW